MKNAVVTLVLCTFLWAFPSQADEMETARLDHGSWYSCVYMNAQECSSRMGTRRASPEASLVIDFYADGKDPVGIRLYTPLDSPVPQIDGRTNHGSIDFDGAAWCKSSYAVYGFTSSECAYVYPEKDFLAEAPNHRECTIHIINEYGVKRSLSFPLDGFAKAKDRTAALLKELPR